MKWWLSIRSKKILPGPQEQPEHVAKFRVLALVWLNFRTRKRSIPISVCHYLKVGNSECDLIVRGSAKTFDQSTTWRLEDLKNCLQQKILFNAETQGNVSPYLLALIEWFFFYQLLNSTFQNTWPDQKLVTIGLNNSVEQALNILVSNNITSAPCVDHFGTFRGFCDMLMLTKVLTNIVCTASSPDSVM